MLLLLSASACSTQPTTPEEAAYYRRMGAAMTGVANQIQQQEQYNLMQNQQMQNAYGNQNCTYTPDGYGGFRSNCSNY